MSPEMPIHVSETTRAGIQPTNRRGLKTAPIDEAGDGRGHYRRVVRKAQEESRDGEVLPLSTAPRRLLSLKDSLLHSITTNGLYLQHPGQHAGRRGRQLRPRLRPRGSSSPSTRSSPIPGAVPRSSCDMMNLPPLAAGLATRSLPSIVARLAKNVDPRTDGQCPFFEPVTDGAPACAQGAERHPERAYRYGRSPVALLEFRQDALAVDRGAFGIYLVVPVSSRTENGTRRSLVDTVSEPRLVPLRVLPSESRSV